MKAQVKYLLIIHEYIKYLIYVKIACTYNFICLGLT
jgi:hypothetical protein